MEGRIIADSGGTPVVVIPVVIYLDLFDALRQGMVGIVQLTPNGSGGWALDMEIAADQDTVITTDQEGSDE